MDPPAKKIKLKCRYDNEIRVVMLTLDAQFSQLKKRLTADYNFEVNLKYEDAEGDMITLSSQNDLDDLLQSGVSAVNVAVAEALPSLQNHRPAPASRAQLGGILSAPSHLDGGIQKLHSQSPLRMSSRGTGTTARDASLFPSVPQQGHPSRSIRWKKAEVIGKGAFGVVFLGLDVDTGGLLAVKQMAIEEVSARELSNLENEINLLKTLEHPNIVRYFGTEVNAQYLTIFLEYVPGGSVKALIEKFGALEEPVARSYTRQLLLGLEYLHRSGIAHRDIKGANCLVGNDGVIKLADFGASKHWRSVTTSLSTQAEINAADRESKERNSDIRGTPQWMAPEVVRGDERGAGGVNWKKADIWSLGCTAIEMTTGRPPWCHLNNPVTVLYHIACSTALPTFPDHASPELITFLNLCLQRDPVNRPEVTSLLLHPFVANVAMGPSASHSYNMVRPSTVSTMPSGSWMMSGLGAHGSTGGGVDTGLYGDRGHMQRNDSFSRIEVDVRDRKVVDSLSVPNSRRAIRPSSSKASAVIPAEMESFVSLHDMSSALPFGKDVGMMPVGDASIDLDMSSSTIDLLDPHRDPLYNSMLYDINIPSMQHFSQHSNEFPTRDCSTDEFDDNYSMRSGLRSVGESSQEAYREERKSRITNQAMLDDINSNLMESDIDADSIDMDAPTPNMNLRRTIRQISPRGSPRLDPLQERPSVDLRSSNIINFTSAPRNRADTDPTDFSSLRSEIEVTQREAKGVETTAQKGNMGGSSLPPNSPLLRPTNTTSKSNIAQNKQLLVETLEKKAVASPKRRNSKVLSPSPAITKSAPLKPHASLGSKDADESPRSSGSVNTSGLVGIILDQRRGLSASSNSMHSVHDDAKGGDCGRPHMSDEEIVDEDEKVYAYKEDTDGSSPYSPVHKHSSNSGKLFSRPNSSRIPVVPSDRIDNDDADEVPEEGTSASGHKRVSSEGNGTFRDHSTAQELSSDDDEAFSFTQVSPPPGHRQGRLQSLGPSLPVETGAKAMLLPNNSEYFSPNERNRVRTVNEDVPAQTSSRAATSMPEKSTRIQSGSSVSLSGTASQPNLMLVAGSSVSKKGDALPGVTRSRVSKSGKPPYTSSQPRAGREASDNIDLESSMDSLRVSGASTAKGAPRHTPSAQTKKSLSDADSSLPAAFGSKTTVKDRNPEANQPRDFSSLRIRGSDLTFRDDGQEAGGYLCDSLMDSIADGNCEPAVLSEHRGAITRLRIVPKYNILLSSSTDGTVRVWGGGAEDVTSRMVLDTNDFKEASSNPSSAKRKIAASEGETTVTSSVRPRVMSTWTDPSFEFVWGACSDGAIRLWQGGNEAHGGKALRLFKGHEDTVTVLEGSEGTDSTLVASGSSDRTVRIWDPRLKRPQAFQFRGHTDGVLSVRWANGGREVISASKDKTVKVWDLRSGRLKYNLERHFGAVTAIKVVPLSVAQQADELSFVSAGRDSMLHGWSAAGDCMGSQAAHRGPIACISDIRCGLSFGPASSLGAPMMLSSGADGLTKLWDLRRMKVISEIATAGTASNTVSKIVWIGESFVTATASGLVLLWNHKSALDNSFGSLSESLVSRNDWSSHSLGEHSFSCTDLQASGHMLACSSKSGVIFRWQ